MPIFIGVIFHFIGGFASGSFYIPFKKVKNWSWESYWLTGGVFSWLLAPLMAAWLTVPGFWLIIGSTSVATLCYTYLLGILWGIGGLTFGLALRYLGISLGQSVALGFCSAFGALIPPIFRDFFLSGSAGTFTEMILTTGGKLVLLGVIVCIGGIFICGRAGMMKERELSGEQKQASIKEFNLSKGLLVAIIAGVLSACFNFGIEAGKPMANMAVKSGCNPLFQNNVIFIVILWGGMTSNAIWCFYLNFRHRTFKDYTDKSTPLLKNYLFSGIAGITWFLQFFFYGMGASKLGNGSSSWILHMAFIILISNLWGFVLKEWKGVSFKTYVTLGAGILVIILSVVLVGYGNSLNI